MHRDKKARGNTLRFVGLEKIGQPFHLNDPDAQAVREAFERVRAVLALMHRDKKARGNTLRFVGLEKIGQPFHLNDPDAQAVREAFERVRQQA